MVDQVLRVHPLETLERQRDHNFTLRGYQSDLVSPAGLQAGDVVRFKVWDSGDVDTAPTLDIDSVALPSATFTADAGTDTLTSNAHGLSNGQRVKLTTSGSLPGGVTTSGRYYVVGATTNTFQLSLTSGGAAIDLTSVGSGTHTWTRVFSNVSIDDLGVNDDTPFEVTVALHRDEVNLLTAGEWNWEASVVKPSADNRCFVFARGTFDVIANAAGDVGVT